MSKTDEIKESKDIISKFKQYVYSKAFFMTEGEYWREKYYGNIK